MQAPLPLFSYTIMDLLIEDTHTEIPLDSGLSYDDTIAYEDLPPPPAPEPANDAGQPSLAGRIGSTKVYLISDSLAKTGKVRGQTLLAGCSV